MRTNAESTFTRKTIDVCNNSETGKMALDNLLSLKDKGPDLPNNKPCAGLNVFLGQPDIGKNTVDDQAFIRLYLKSEVKVKSVILYYDFTTLAADIGGYIGMFLGYALLNLPHFFITISESIKRGFREIRGS